MLPKLVASGWAFSLVMCMSAQASTVVTGEGMFAHRTAQHCSLFYAQNGQRIPSSWADLEPYLSRPFDKYYYWIQPTKRYAFLTKPLPLSREREGCEVIIIARRPFRDASFDTSIFGPSLRQPGRYVICYEIKNGDFFGFWMPEVSVQQAFRDTPSLLPEPDTEPMRPREMKAWLNFVVGWIIFGVCAAGVVWLLFRRENEWPINVWLRKG